MKQYSFYNTDLLIDGARVDGFTAGQAVITARRNAPQHVPVLDAYGKLAVATTADLSGTITFPLLQTADWNEILYTKAQLTQATGLSGNKTMWQPMQIQLVDKMGDVLVNGVNGAILQQPAIIRGVTFTSNMWAIFVERLQIKTGSYPDIGV
ncbi:hypothetical protein PM1_048 [Pectobacterium phage PM1]|uniref:Tail tube protein n=2 Tax=Suwonvirus TaxID=2732964 RepID=A0A1J0MF92_9CAUD|nr:virion structural protein [Pectobacterium phage PM1]YP_009788079.1 virion structural protein [Pectobacterium phage PP101]AGV99264.1 hypothetical protein PM1_048 [Pectobacterium phage PM1]APD19721.1 tail tube protein [Pectobacterium phage PP101]